MTTKIRQPFLFILGLFLLTFTALGQEVSLSTQLSDIIDRSESYENYKVIKTANLVKFRSSMLDSLYEYKMQISSLEAEMAEVKADLKVLMSDHASAQAQLTESKAQNESIAFLWFTVNKSSYNAVLWSFVVALLSIVVVLYFRIKHVCAVVKRVKSAYSKVIDDYKTQRHQSVEKQMKLKREIQTMQNRLEMLQSLDEPAAS